MKPITTLRKEDVQHVYMMIPSPTFDAGATSRTAREMYVRVNPTHPYEDWQLDSWYDLARTKRTYPDEMVEAGMVSEFREQFLSNPKRCSSAIVQIAQSETAEGSMFFALFTMIKDIEQPGRVFPPLEYPIKFTSRRWWQFWQ